MRRDAYEPPLRRGVVRVLTAIVVAACGVFAASRAAPAGEAPSAYYLSPDGSDAAGCSRADPCASLEKARDRMRASKVKTVYLLPGTYALKSVVELGPADDGARLSGAPDQRWDAAVIDAGGRLESAICLRGASNVTIENLKIRDVEYGGVMIHGGAGFGPNDCTRGATTRPASGNVVREVEVVNIIVPDAARYSDTGGVLAEGEVRGTVVSNVLVADSNGMCVRASAHGGRDDISGFRVLNSVFLRCMKRNGDGGAIYMQDYLSTSTDIVIENNYVKDYGNGAGSNNRCFYGDAATSNVIFRQNICANPGSRDVAGDASVIFLCGADNLVTQNVFDLGSSGKVITYQYGGCDPPARKSAMTGNAFAGNIVIGGFRGAQRTEWAGAAGAQSFYSGDVQPAYPKVVSNVYWNYAGGIMNTAGVVMQGDSAPMLRDPLCSGGSLYRISERSPAFRAGYAAPPRGWGPRGYVPPTGEAASCPQ